MLSLSIDLEGSNYTKQHRENVQVQLLAWYERHKRDLPWRHARDPYAILVSEVMLQQTQVDRVAPKYEEFLSIFPGFQALAGARAADVIRAWSPLGYNRRAINLHRLARAVVEHHNGQLPRCTKQLRSLPGVGAYTAAAVACFAFDSQEAVIDTNISRVLARVEGSTAPSPSKLRARATAYLPPERAQEWNQALMDLGATVCRATAPACALCPLRGDCSSAGSIVREKRATYRTGGARYQGSDRNLRGRIVEALRAIDGSINFQALAAMVQLTDAAGNERLETLITGLVRDGLVERTERTVALPTR
jgi:A/G-specific adenine glycosylase